MVVCNLFDVDIIASGNDLSFVDIVIRTDLPSGTQVIYSTDRYYRDSRGEQSLWVGQGDRVEVVDGECRESPSKPLEDGE